MSTFQIPIFSGMNTDTTEVKNVAPLYSNITRTRLNIPFQNGRLVKIVSVDCVHELAGTPTPILCVLKSAQIYNPVAGSRDIYFSSNGMTNFDDIYLNPNFQNNENITVVLENADIQDNDEFIDNFRYFLLTLKIV